MKLGIGKRVVLGAAAVIVCSAAFAGPAGAQPGDLSPLWGNRGVVAYPEIQVLGGLVAEDDGSMAAWAWLGPQESAIVRLRPSGALDPSFSGDGIVERPGTQPPDDLAVAADGSIIVSGPDYADSSGTTTLLTRFRRNGSLDTSFGTGGTLAVAARSGRMELDSAGRILLGDPTGSVRRLLPDGSADPSWTVSAPLPGAVYGGNELVVGSGDDVYTGTEKAIAHLDDTGALDPGWSGDGILPFEGYDMALADDGGIWVSRPGSFALRLLPDSSIAPGFSSVGTPVPGWEIVPGKRGSAYFIGEGEPGLTRFASYTTVVARVESSGWRNDDFDEGFGVRGTAWVYPRAESMAPHGAALAPDGDLLIAGQGVVPSGKGLLVRLLDRLASPRNSDADPFDERHDRCTLLPASHHLGCPRRGRPKVRIARTGRRVIAGVMAYVDVNCRTSLKVVISRKRKPKETIASTLTNPHGYWRAERKFRPGRYLVQSRSRIQRDVGFCPPSRPKPLRVR